MAPAEQPSADSVSVRRLHRLRLWFSTYLAWLLALAAVAMAMFARYESGDAAAVAPWLLALATFYLSLCNTLVPLPTAWIFLLLASDDVMLFDSALLRITTVAVLGATATMMANLNEYHLFGYFLRNRLGDRLRRTHVYRWAIRWFDLAPFQTLTLVAFVPIPIDFVRWLAILRRYPRSRFAAAYWLGRLPRYALLAGIAVALHLNFWEIIAIQVALVAILATHLAWTTLCRKRTPPASSTAQEATPPA